MSPVTCRPQAAITIATITTASPSQRYILTSPAVVSTAVTVPCAFALHLAFPRANLPWVAPLALAGLFAAWMMVRPLVAAIVGYLAGLVFFGANFAWFGETAGALLGPFGVLLDLGPAALEALAFALAAGLSAVAAARLRGAWIAIIAAAGFTGAEMLRSSGVLGLPLYQIGAAFVDTPLAPLAAFGGVYALTFSVSLLGAAIAVCARTPDRGRLRLLLVAGGVTLSAGMAWLAWPARAVKPGTLRVAAVQGNITQSIKWDAASLPVAVERYTTLTRSVRAFEPRFVLWPETVITTDLRLDPALAAVPANARLAAAATALQRRFRSLARELDAVIVVGSNEATAGASFNDLFFFRPDGGPSRPYRKRRLVPFAEYLPGPAWLRGLPFAELASDIGAGADAQPLGALGASPLICWESGFGGLAQRDAARGARFFAVATDDAWFGSSDGPYAQAQLAQLRAIETGRWIVRAAATGISGIVAPDGTWQARSALGTQAVITGTIGDPSPTPYSRIGPLPIGLGFALLGVAGFTIGRRRRK